MNISRSIYAVVALSAIIATATFAEPTAAMQKGDTKVVVTNGTSNPVPTSAQGTTMVAGTVALESDTQVGISGTPTVTVGNGSSSPVPVALVGGIDRVPFDDQGAVGLLPGAGSGSTDLYTVPAGHRLVIETANVHGETRPGTTVAYAGLSRAGEITFAIPVTQQGVVGGVLQSVGHVNGPFFFGPGTTVRFLAAITNPAEDAFIRITVSGYLESVGS